MDGCVGNCLGEKLMRARKDQQTCRESHSWALYHIQNRGPLGRTAKRSKNELPTVAADVTLLLHHTPVGAPPAPETFRSFYEHLVAVRSLTSVSGGADARVAPG